MTERVTEAVEGRVEPAQHLDLGSVEHVEIAAGEDVDDPVDQRALGPLAACAEELIGVLANGLEQAELAFAPDIDHLDEMVVDELRHHIVVRGGHGPRRVEREVPGEHRHGGKGFGLSRTKQIHTAPCQRLAQGLLARGQVARAARQPRQSGGEPLVQPLESECPHPRGGELDRQREPVDATTDTRDEGRRRGSSRNLHPQLSSLREQVDGIVLGQGCYGIHVFARHVEDDPGRRYDDESRRRSDQPDELGGRRPQVLEVVEHEEELPIAEGFGKGGLRIGGRMTSSARATVASMAAGSLSGASSMSAAPFANRGSSDRRARARAGSCRCRRRP